MGKVCHGNRHSPHPWPRSPISGCCHRTVMPSMGSSDGKEFALVIGDSHLRSFVDGYAAMPPDKFSFGFMCTPGASANGPRKEICHAEELPLDPAVVCLLAPGNNLVSSLTIDMASKDFESLLKAALYRWPELFVLEFPIRFPDQHDGDIPLDYQVHLQQEYHRVATRMGVRYISTIEHFPAWNRLRVRPTPPRRRRTAIHSEATPPPQATCPVPPQQDKRLMSRDQRRWLLTAKAEQNYMDVLQGGANRSRIIPVKSAAVLSSPSSYRVPTPPQPASEPKAQRQRNRWRRATPRSKTPITPPSQPTCSAPPRRHATLPPQHSQDTRLMCRDRRKCVPTTKAEQKYKDILQGGATRSRIILVKSVAVLSSFSSYRVPAPPQPAKALDYKQIETEHICTTRCQEHQESNVSVPTPLTGSRSSPTHNDFDIIGNGGWLNDNIIDEYHKLLQSKVKEMAVFICSATFVSQELRSLCCDIDVFPKIPKASQNWWKYDTVIVPVHTRSHWTSIVIDLKHRIMADVAITVEAELMDSLKQYESQLKDVLLLLQRYLTLQYLALNGLVVDITVNYKCYHKCPNFLQQTSGSSCGIFACLHSKAVMFGVTMNKFKECNKAKCVAYELSEQKLIL